MTVREWQRRGGGRSRFVSLALQMEPGLAGICGKGRFWRWTAVCGVSGTVRGLLCLGAASGRTWVLSACVGAADALARRAVQPEWLAVGSPYMPHSVLPKVYPLARLRADIVGPVAGVEFVIEVALNDGK